MPSTPTPVQEGHVAYGIDALGRVVVDRHYVGLTHGARHLYTEQFFAYDPAWVEGVLYDQHKEPIAVNRATLSGLRVSELAKRGRGGGVFSRYTYDDDRLVRIDQDVIAQSDGTRGWSQWYDVAWDDLGRVAKVTQQTKDSPGYIVFERKQRGESLASLVAELEKQLVAEIPKRVAALALTAPIYSLVLAYDGSGNPDFPPALGVGLVSERNEWSTLSYACDLIWNPAEYSLYDTETLAVRDPALCALAEKVNRLIDQAGANGVGAKALNRVATSLRTLGWSAIAPVTDDFVIYAIPFELGGLYGKLKAATTKAHFDRWAKAGWLP